MTTIMTTLELFQQKARELIQDKEFLADDTRYSCHEMRDYAASRRREDSFNHSYRYIEELGNEFREKLLAEPVDTVGFELGDDVRVDLSSEVEPCTAFVHTASQLDNGDYCTERMTAVRTAWLQFVIDYEE